MAQITTGIRRILSHPIAYRFTQLLLGATHARTALVREFIQPKSADAILDIGCGTAEILDFLPETVEYIGIDLSQEYISFAKKKHGNRGKFHCNDLNKIKNDLPKFDTVLAIGLLHHLNDDEADKLFAMAASCLKSTGKLITLDGCYEKSQSKIAKFIISKDRGQNIRTPEEYNSFALKTFRNVKTDIKHDLLRIPYTHFIMQCSNASI